MTSNSGRQHDRPTTSTRVAGSIRPTPQDKGRTFAELEKEVEESNDPEEEDEEVPSSKVCDRCQTKGLVCTRKRSRNACEECTTKKFKCSNVPAPEVQKGKRKTSSIDDDSADIESERYFKVKNTHF